MFLLSPNLFHFRRKGHIFMKRGKKKKRLFLLFTYTLFSNFKREIENIFTLITIAELLIIKGREKAKIDPKNLLHKLR